MRSGAALALMAAMGFALSSCMPMQDAADAIARDQARSVVNAELQRRFPGVDASPLTDCVIDNASAQEIITIAGGVAMGQSGAATDTIGTILERPETVRCAGNAYLGGVLGGLV